jgi:putative phosphoesterase
MTTIGVISDTHGLLRAEAIEALRGCDRILHAGDIGSQSVLDELATLAPVTAIRGNNDTAEWARAIPETSRVTIDGVQIYLLHNLKDLALDPRAEDIDVVIAGHSHRPALERRDGVLFLNPGSAGPRRFKLPISVARLRIDNGTAQAELIELAIASKR